MAVWLQAKVRDRELGLRPMLYAGSVCDDHAARAAYAATVALHRYIYEPYIIIIIIIIINILTWTRIMLITARTTGVQTVVKYGDINIRVI